MSAAYGSYMASSSNLRYQARPAARKGMPFLSSRLSSRISSSVASGLSNGPAGHAATEACALGPGAPWAQLLMSKPTGGRPPAHPSPFHPSPPPAPPLSSPAHRSWRA